MLKAKQEYLQSFQFFMYFTAMFSLKYHLLTVSFICVCFTVNAQRFTLNLVGGITSSQISGDGNYGFAQFGGVLGAEVNYNWNDKWSTSLGLEVNQKGARTYQKKTSYNAYRLRVNYAEVPVVMNYSYRKWQFRLGLYGGVRINSKERDSYGDITPKREFYPFELGVLAEIAYSFHPQWSLGLRFQNSILPVRDHQTEQLKAPSLFVLGDWHQELLNQGQYYTSLSLLIKYTIR